jgi:hypothetical protein
MMELEEQKSVSNEEITELEKSYTFWVQLKSKDLGN